MRSQILYIPYIYICVCVCVYLWPSTDHYQIVIKYNLLYFYMIYMYFKKAQLVKEMICVLRTIQSNMNNSFFCFLILLKNNLHITVVCETFSLKNSPNCFTLDCAIHIRNSRLRICSWCCIRSNRSGKKLRFLCSLSLALSFRSFLPSFQCFAFALLPFSFSVLVLDHDHTIITHWTTTKVISGGLYFERKVINDKTITIELESVSWFIFVFWTLDSHWLIIMKDETSQMGINGSSLMGNQRMINNMNKTKMCYYFY